MAIFSIFRGLIGLVGGSRIEHGNGGRLHRFRNPHLLISLEEHNVDLFGYFGVANEPSESELLLGQAAKKRLPIGDELVGASMVASCATISACSEMISCESRVSVSLVSRRAICSLSSVRNCAIWAVSETIVGWRSVYCSGRLPTALEVDKL